MTELRHIVNGRHEIYYGIHGQGKEVMVLLHGFPANAQLWRETLTFMGDVTIITPDLLGYGSSSRARAQLLTLPRQAAYIGSLLRALNISGVHVVGHELGGGIAQLLALYEPQLVQSVVLMDSVCFDNWPIPQVESLRYPTLPLSQRPELFVETLLRQGIYVQPLVTPELVGRFMPPYTGPAAFAEFQQCALALDNRDTQALSPNLGQIPIPSTILWGEFDRLLPADWGWRLHQTIPGSTFRIIRDAGHYAMIDQPQAVATELQLHLNRTAAEISPSATRFRSLSLI